MHKKSEMAPTAMTTFETYLSNLPMLHSWDGGVTWNTGGFERGHLEKLHTFLKKNLPSSPVMLETGAGNSTISFLFLAPKRLVSITPEAQLFDRIRSYCEAERIPIAALDAHVDGSEWVLPKMAAEIRNEAPILDFALIDGSHNWPMVFVDFCYINQMLKVGGYLMIDDVQLHSVKELARMLSEQPGFELALDLGKSLVFRRTTEMRALGEWGQLPYIVRKTNDYAKCSNPFFLQDACAMLNSNHERWKNLGAEDKGYYFEFIVESAINSIVRNGDTCVDVGVNFGAHAFTMLGCVGSGGSVVGFEPNPTCYKRLSEWPSHGKNFFLHNVALSDSEGEAELHIAPENEIPTLHSSVLTRLDMLEASSITVPLKRLDDFGLKSCRLIKIDVDGEEFRCLSGATETITRLRPCVFIEVMWALATDDMIESFFDWVRSLNYVVLDCFNGLKVEDRISDSWMVVLWPNELDTKSIKISICEWGEKYLDEFIGWNHYKKFES